MDRRRATLTGRVLLVVLIGMLQLIAGSSASARPNLLTGLSQVSDGDVFVPLIIRGNVGGDASEAPPDDPPDNEVHTGQATFYGATGAGNCSFDATPDNLMVAAMNTTDYANALLCGAYVEVTGADGVVTVRIVDRCPECGPGHIDLSAEAFAAIADPIQGIVPISWVIVSPELAGPLVYRFKEGSSQYWTAVQVRNHRNPIATLEYQTSDGSFTMVPREMYNYFVEAGGMGPGPYTFRVTDIYGQVLVDEGIELIEAGEVSGAAQFAAP